jgi:hypothetical protein
VHALVLGRRGPGGTQDARYLISDPDKALPFWVDQDEIDRLCREEAEEAEEEHVKDQAETPTATAEATATAEEQGAESATATAEEPAQEAEQPQADHAGLMAVPDQTRVLGYVSIVQNGDPGAADMRDQAQSIDSLCRQRGWTLLELVRDTETAGRGSLERPGLRYAIERVRKGEASCIVVSGLSRLGNSASDLSRVLESVTRSEGRLVVMDVGLDTGPILLQDEVAIEVDDIEAVCREWEAQGVRFSGPLKEGRDGFGPLKQRFTYPLFPGCGIFFELTQRQHGDEQAKTFVRGTVGRARAPPAWWMPGGTMIWAAAAPHSPPVVKSASAVSQVQRDHG